VSREQAQLVRLLLVCAAWAIGQTLTYGLSIQGFDVIIPAGLAVGVYAVTDDLGRGGTRGRSGTRGRGGAVKYWRGRPVDDERRDRWN
jgi:hypothetical protein